MRQDREKSIRMDIKERLSQLGLKRLSLEQMRTIADSFGRDLQAGLEKRQSSIAPIPTFLSSVDTTHITPGMALVVEIGGTNIYTGKVTVDHKNQVQVQDRKEVALSQSKHRKYESAQEFFDEVTDTVVPIVQEKPDALGIIWSFPAEIKKTQNGVDAISTTSLTKEFVIPGIGDESVGEYLIEALQRKNIAIPSDIPRAVANDTVGVLLGAGETIGGIIGTGFNLAFGHNGQIYNLEAGGFSHVPQTTLTQAIDAQSDKPGHYLAEKQISGEYTEKTFVLVARSVGITSSQPLTTQVMSELLMGKHIDNFSPEDADVLREIAEILRDRSAQLVSSMIVGTVNKYPQDFDTNNITIPIEGSFFTKTPGYKQTLEQEIAKLIPDKSVTCTPVTQSAMKGIGLAALNQERVLSHS